MTARRARRAVIAGAASVALTMASITTTGAHAPDPLIGWPAWNQDQAVRFRWMAGEVPPLAMQAAIRAAATDSNESKYSRAPTFAYAQTGTSTVEYGANVFCGPAGLACADGRNAPATFKIGFRLHGWSFDWGRLGWCQLQDPIANGCFDVENVMLDELGHVLGLAHHVNFTDGRDYGDSVVQTVSRARPQAFWNEHDFGRCDIAALQLRYDMTSWTAGYSTCLDLPTVVTLTRSASSIRVGSTVTFTATLHVEDNAGDGRVGGNPVSKRTVYLERRAPGASTWTRTGQMAAATSAGTYTLKQSPTATYEWRAVFPNPAEGLRGDSSPTATVTVSGCSGSTCPQSAPAAQSDDSTWRTP